MKEAKTVTDALLDKNKAIKESSKKLASANAELEKEITGHKQTSEKLRDTFAEMARMNRLMTGREERVIEMKKEVNALLAELGRKPRYASVLEIE